MLILLQVSYASLTKVTRVVIIKADHVMMQITDTTVTTQLLSVFSNMTLPLIDMSMERPHLL